MGFYVNSVVLITDNILILNTMLVPTLSFPEGWPRGSSTSRRHCACPEDPGPHRRDHADAVPVPRARVPSLLRQPVLPQKPVTSGGQTTPPPSTSQTADCWHPTRGGGPRAAPQPTSDGAAAHPVGHGSLRPKPSAATPPWDRSTPNRRLGPGWAHRWAHRAHQEGGRHRGLQSEWQVEAAVVTDGALGPAPPHGRGGGARATG